MSLGKVTCFITRSLDGRKHVLLLKHPYAGNQIPAGTVEKGESFVAAALREAREETGLDALNVVAELLSEREKLPPNTAVIQQTSTVYSRPDTSSFDWVTIRRGIRVDTRETENGFVQIDYVEKELLGSDKTSFQITGWIPQDALTTAVERKHYHLSCAASNELEWEVFSDHYRFVLMWHPLTEDPQFPLDSLGLCYDSSHDYLHSSTPSAVLDKWGHRLITTHFSDTDGQGDVHWLPMKGIVDWDAVSRAYPTSHQGPIMIEAVPQDRAQPPTEFLADAYETAIKLRKKLVSLPNCRE